MSQNSIPVSGIRAAFDRAASAHQTLRSVPAVRDIPARPLSAITQPATSVEAAIANAARQTGIDFDFLVKQAEVESAMNPNARARTSSATGLYQFIDSTWLGTMQRHGERFGLGDVAAAITINGSGNAHVADPARRQEILALRNDPQIASLMAAGLAEDNRAHLAPILGRQPDHSELYLAHFLGAGGAGRFLSALAQDPSQPAADLFRRPAAANRPVFYEANGSPRSLAGVMEYLSAKLERARGATPPADSASYRVAAFETNAAAPQRTVAMRTSARPMIAASAPANIAPSISRPPMSSLLQTAFADGNTGLSERSARQVRNAYEQLKALGL